MSTLFVATTLHKSIAHNSTTIIELICNDAIAISRKILTQLAQVSYKCTASDAHADYYTQQQ